MSYKTYVYTVIDKKNDDSIISTGLYWEEVIALVDYLDLDYDDWDVIEYEIDVLKGD